MRCKRNSRVLTLWTLTMVSFLLMVPALGRAKPVSVAMSEHPCVECHRNLILAFTNTTHGKAMQFEQDRFSGSCEVCHGDGAAHSESDGKARIASPDKLSTVAANDGCLKCHATEKHTMFWQGSQHDLAGAGCLSCHSVHHARRETALLKTRTETELCLTCHPSIRKAQLQRSTHLFRDEHLRPRVECSSCHNAHGTPSEKLIEANSINDKCTSCHADKRGPFLWEHPPVKENCLTCHSPHGSNQPNLLTVRAPMLCQSCHIQSAHQTVAGRPNSIWNMNRSCLNCHPLVHGSNHPSGIILMR